MNCSQVVYKTILYFIASPVQVSVTISPAPSRGYYLTGDSAIVTCLADGFPLAHYLKLSKDQQVFVEYHNGSTSGIVKNDHNVMFKRTISTLKLADNGNYKCEAVNQLDGTDYFSDSVTSLDICKCIFQLMCLASCQRQYLLTLKNNNREWLLWVLKIIIDSSFMILLIYVCTIYLLYTAQIYNYNPIYF